MEVRVRNDELLPGFLAPELHHDGSIALHEHLVSIVDTVCYLVVLHTHRLDQLILVAFEA